MSTIKFNKEVEMEVESYNRNTTFNIDGSITSNASCNVHVDNISTLNDLALQPITAIQIYTDGNLIYDLDNINARVESIGEYLNMGIMGTNMNIVFIFDNE